MVLGQLGLQVAQQFLLQWKEHRLSMTVSGYRIAGDFQGRKIS